MMKLTTPAELFMEGCATFAKGTPASDYDVVKALNGCYFPGIEKDPLSHGILVGMVSALIGVNMLETN